MIEMDTELIVAGVVAVLMLAYLAYALIRAEEL
jgi:K+-transporting ATPase KdpF subunit